MRISAKARYRLAALVSMSGNSGNNCTTVISLAEKLNISKIYLEQVFSLLKRSGIVTSVKGAQGGYYLSKPAGEITAFDVLSAIETSLFEGAEETVAASAPHIERALQEMAFRPLDHSIKKSLSGITIEDLSNKSAEYCGVDYMYYL